MHTWSRTSSIMPLRRRRRSYTSSDVPRGAVALPQPVENLTAEERLVSILDSGHLRAYPVPDAVLNHCSDE